LRLGLPGYLVHGTDKPFGIGMQVTHGCMRLYPEDIESLFNQVPVGTPVRIVNQPYKSGWHNGVLHIEAHPPLDDSLVMELTPLVERIVASVQPYPDYRVDWNQAETLALQTLGIPMDLRSVTPFTRPRSTPVPQIDHQEAPPAPIEPKPKDDGYDEEIWF
jgi:L,D-transpeptidase ErfK/SrfK